MTNRHIPVNYRVIGRVVQNKVETSFDRDESPQNAVPTEGHPLGDDSFERARIAGGPEETAEEVPEAIVAHLVHPAYVAH